MFLEKLNNQLCKRINHITLPLILNSVTGMIIGLCDQAMVGRISLFAFGAVGLISTTVNSITGVLGMNSVSLNIIGAKLKGEGKISELKNQFLINIMIDVFAGILFFLAAIMFGRPVLRHLYSLDGEILKLSVDYLNVFSISLGMNMILFTFASYFKIVGSTRYIFYANIISSISNVVFDYILIFGKLGFKGMGVRGNAIGSVLALALGILVYLFAIRKDMLFKAVITQPLKALRKITAVTLPLMGQEVLESTVFVIIINSILSCIGVVEVSVYNLLLSVVNISLMPMYSYSQTSLTLISENIGAGNKENVRLVPEICLGFAVFFYCIIGLVILAFNRYAIMLITNDLELIRSSAAYLFLAVFISLFNIPSIVYKYSLQGIEDEKWVFASSVIINLLGAGCLLVLGIALKMGLYGVYAGMLLNYLFLSAAFYLRYKSKTCKFI